MLVFGRFCLQEDGRLGIVSSTCIVILLDRLILAKYIRVKKLCLQFR